MRLTIEEMVLDLIHLGDRKKMSIVHKLSDEKFAKCGFRKVSWLDDKEYQKFIELYDWWILLLSLVKKNMEKWKGLKISFIESFHD